MCTQENWHVLRLDGTVSATKRTKLVEEFNCLHNNSFVFLLSSKAGGCGINLIGNDGDDDDDDDDVNDDNTVNDYDDDGNDDGDDRL